MMDFQKIKGIKGCIKGTLFVAQNNYHQNLTKFIFIQVFGQILGLDLRGDARGYHLLL